MRKPRKNYTPAEKVGILRRVRRGIVNFRASHVPRKRERAGITRPP